MNGNGLDIISIIFLGVAVVIFLYLRSILGSRTGNEHQHYDPFGSDKAENTPQRDVNQDHDNVVTMPDRREAEDTAPQTQEIDVSEKIKKFAQESSDLGDGLTQIANADQTFDPDQFMEGAEIAYEMIISSFSEGDKRTLKRLLAKDVFAGFSDAIDQREAQNQTMTTQFVGFEKVSMLEAGLEDKQAEITVKFKSSLIRYIQGQDGDIVEGDEKAIEKITDIWTFSRSVSGRDPNWKLISTKSES